MAIKIIPFSGEQADWIKWFRTFIARANIRGFKNILTGKVVVPVEMDDDVTAEKEETMRLNDLAYAELMMSCQSDACFGIVDNARSTELPDGDAYKAWKDLQAKFEPNTKAALVATKLDFSKSKLENASTDPDEWIKTLESLRRRLEVMGSAMDDLDMVVHVLNNLPSEYDTMIETLESDFDSGNLTMEKV